jgi:hypothetical protein
VIKDEKKNEYERRKAQGDENHGSASKGETKRAMRR